MRKNKNLLIFSVALFAFGLGVSGCKEKGGNGAGLSALAGLLGAGGSDDNRIPEIVQVGSSVKAQGVGTKQKLSAIGIDANYVKWDASEDLEWSSSNPKVATVENSGIVTAVGAGKTTITGKSRLGKRAAGSVEVEVHTAHIEHIVVTPSVPVYSPEKLPPPHEDEEDDDDDEHEKSSDQEHGKKGKESKESEEHHKKGDAKKHHDHEEEDDDDDDHHVNLVTPSIVAGTTQSFFAIAEFSNNTVQDITPFVTWSSSNPAVATVSNEPGSQGVATGISAGVAMIIATDPVTGKAGAIQLTVTAPVLQSITLNPPGMSIPNGTNGQIVATGNYSNGTVQDLTPSVVWSSGDATIATVATGLVAGVGVGTVQITATDSASGVAASASVTILPAELISITVAPAAPSVAKGLTQNFTASGAYTDNTVKDLTTQVTWTSSDAMIASVSNVLGSEGLATGSGVGVATIQATMPASAANPALISGSTTLNVTPAVLVGVTVSPASAIIPLNGSVRFSATGKYTDATIGDVTALVTWQGSPAVSVSNAPGTEGVATGVAPGSGTVTAIDPATGISAVASVQVQVAYRREFINFGYPPIVHRGTVDTANSQYNTAYAAVSNISVSGMSDDVDLIVDRTYPYQSCYSYCCGFFCLNRCTSCNTYWTTQRMCNGVQAGLAPEACYTGGAAGNYHIYVLGNKTRYGAEFTLSVQ